ncbi:unnamed protein product [Camellia sinensis]
MKQFSHFSHRHLLNFTEVGEEDEIICSGCELNLSGSAAYSCTKSNCSFTIHTSCFELPQQIRHRSHPKHPLILLSSPPYTDGEFTSDARGESGVAFTYHCSTCSFDLHVGCASLPESEDCDDHEQGTSKTRSSSVMFVTVLLPRTVGSIVVRNGGWIAVVRKWRSGGAQNKEGKKGIFTVFVDNIPSAMDANVLFKLFTKFGIVKDAFIPFKRRNVTNSRFGFVRYDCRIATSVAIQKANGLLVDDMMLVVKMATYNRSSSTNHNRRKSQDARRCLNATHIRGNAAYVGHRSFAEVLKGENPVENGNSRITIQVNGEGNGWLYDNIIVRFNREYTTHSIFKALKEKELEQIEVREWGGRDIIISFNSTNELQSNIDKIKELFKGWSQSVMVWKPNLHLQQERCVWLRCRGIPLHLWNRNTLNSIGSLWGTILSLDGDICHPKSFSHTRIRVATACMELINKTILLECKGKFYSILVCEEHLANSGGLKLLGMNESSFTGTSYSEAVRNTPTAAVKSKLDGDEVAEMRDILGADLACTTEFEQPEEPIGSHIGEEIGTVVEETCCVGGSNRTKGACVEGTLMEGSEQNSKNNDGKLRCVQQVASPGAYRDGFGPGINMEVFLANEPTEVLGPGIGPNINLDVNLAHSPKRFLASSSSNRPIESGHSTHFQSAGPLDKSRPNGISLLNLNHPAQVKSLVPNPDYLQTERKKGKKKTHIEGFNSFARFHSFRSAAAHKHSSKSVIFRPAASTLAKSDLSESGSSSNNYLLDEAKATIHLGKSLGVNYNRDEDVVLSKIIDLELKDKKMGRIKSLIKDRNIDIVFLQEIKKAVDSDNAIRRLWGCKNMDYMSVDPEGSAGGLLCIWDPAVFQLSSCCCNRSARSTLWADILKLKDHFPAPWCMGGDFNEIRHIGERIGCSRRDMGMKHLNEFIEKCELNDLPLHGKTYTWCNAQESEKWSLIDRVLLGPEWLINFRMKLWGLPRLISDH